jgi:hypothetical protein
MVKRMFLNNLEFMLASLTYMAAHVSDYLLTITGIRRTAITEGNPVIQGYIDLLGLENGLIIGKLLICCGVICGAKIISIAYKRKETKIKAESILYAGAILTTLGGLLWLCF